MIACSGNEYSDSEDKLKKWADESSLWKHMSASEQDQLVAQLDKCYAKIKRRSQVHDSVLSFKSKLWTVVEFIVGNSVPVIWTLIFIIVATVCQMYPDYQMFGVYGFGMLFLIKMWLEHFNRVCGNGK